MKLNLQKIRAILILRATSGLHWSLIVSENYFAFYGCLPPKILIN